MKTLIELFDDCQTENVIAGIRFQPEKIIYVGDPGWMTKKRMSDVQRFFEMKGLDTALEFELVDGYDFNGIIDRLNTILDHNEDCCFDLTGGRPMLLAAMGTVSAERNVPMIQIVVRSGTVLRVKNCDDLIIPEVPPIKIKEYVRLYGGTIVEEEANDFTWNFHNDFKRDIETMWEICRANCKLWNKQSLVFDKLEQFGHLDNDLTVCVDLKNIPGGKQSILLDPKMIHQLTHNQLLLDYSLENEILTFRYKNEQIRQCLLKAGNILELYGFTVAQEIAKEDPGYYDDMDIGIYVDWDGVIHDKNALQRDTRNEIDIILMRDSVPIFISCKNGEVHKEDLYELDTVAKKFGGKHARKILLSTYVSSNEDTRKYLLQRALDMKIEVVNDVDRINHRNQLKALFKQKIR